jgi:hypothetical protein
MKNGEELIDGSEGMAIGRKNLIAGFLGHGNIYVFGICIGLS